MAKETANVPAIPRPDDEALREITSIDDALELLRASGVATRDIADEIGTGFTLLSDEEKGQLVGKPFLALAWAFSVGNFGEFVTAFIVTEDGQKVIVNDGSTGICQQLSGYTADTGRQNGLLVRHGLRRSDYHIDKETGEVVPRDFTGPKVPATTFYLDTSR